jgi:hypothetical protein
MVTRVRRVNAPRSGPKCHAFRDALPSQGYPRRVAVEIELTNGSKLVLAGDDPEMAMNRVNAAAGTVRGARSAAKRFLGHALRSLSH